jgi:hypothetical protein
MSKTIFDTTQNGADYQMTVNGLSVGLNMPEALKTSGTGETEFVHSLPPYRPRRAYLVDEYPACPDSWMRSSGRVKSYFVPVLKDAGLWLDFNGCWSHAHYAAIVVSVQGINAVTGLPCKDPQLEQYRDECPKHKEAFGPDRLCKKCNFKWPKQNYLSGASTPYGSLWLDGFRAEDGKVRQYVFTESEARSVAKAVIGGDRVHALGISFFLSKEAKPKPQQNITRSYHTLTAPHVDTMMIDNSLSFGPIGCEGDSGPSGDNIVTSWGASLSSSASNDAGNITYSAGSTEKYSADLIPLKGTMKSAGGMKRSLDAKPRATASVNMMSMKKSLMSAPGASIPKINMVQQLEVAAGARINQQVYDDQHDLEFWQKEPDGLIIINYCSAEDALKIINAGKVDVSGSNEGFLQKVPTGNP